MIAYPRTNRVFRKDSAKNPGRTVTARPAPPRDGAAVVAEVAGRPEDCTASEMSRAEPEHTAVEVLDGDEVRRTLSSGLGFSRNDREENVRRIAFVAALLARNGVDVLVPVIAPYARGRDEARSAREELAVAFVEVHVAAPAEVCAERDVKGLYALQGTGKLTGLTGFEDVYEVPVAPELCCRRTCRAWPSPSTPCTLLRNSDLLPRRSRER